MAALGWLAAPVIIGYILGLGPASWVLGAAVFGAWYVRDVKRHARVGCRICSGGGDEYSKIGGGGWFRRPLGDCWCCGGRKTHPRLALRIIDPAAHRRIKNEIARAKGKT